MKKKVLILKNDRTGDLFVSLNAINRIINKHLNEEIVIFSCSALFFASLLGLTLNAINNDLEAFARVTSVSVIIPISERSIFGLTSSCLI